MRRRELVNGVRFYYDHPSDRREPLGGDWPSALEKYAAIERETLADVPTVKSEREVFRTEYLPGLAPGTQYMYARAIGRLTRVFGACRYDQVEPSHLVRYVKQSTAKTLAKRDIGTLSAFWSWARAEGRTLVPNPRDGLMIRTRREDRKPGRYVTDDEFAAVHAQSDWILQDVLELLYLSGQDVRVVLGWRRDQIRWEDGVLDTVRTKTQKPMRIALRNDDGTLTDFARALKRALERPRRAQSLYVIADDRGRPVTYMRVWGRFKAARKAAGVDLELRQIRPKTASDSATLADPQELLGHEDSRMTRRHYRRGEKVKPLR
jgi:integrase